MLPEALRIAARGKARENLIAKLGGEPQFEQFEKRVHSRFGSWPEGIALAALILVLAAAFIISAVHIYGVGKQTYLRGNGDEWVAIIMGAALVVLAESAILALSIVPTLWETPWNVTWGMYAGIAGAAFVAAIGNIDATIFYNSSPFNWIESWWEALASTPARWTIATLPPFMTVLVGLALKYLFLSKSRTRHEAKIAYEAAMQQWQQTTAQLEEHADWRETYAWALWDTWRSKRAKLAAQLTPEERQAVVLREMQADAFFSESYTENSSEKQPRQATETVTPRQRVLGYLREHPEVAEQLKRNERTQADLGLELGAHQTAVHRAFQDYKSSNGHEKQ